MSKLIALTGSIGSGKSAVAELLRENGALIIDADVLARNLLSPGTEAYHETIALFGADIVTKEGEINRRTVAERIFSDATMRVKLEQILHPRVQQAFQSELQRLRADSPEAIIVYVVPLLFEAGRDLSQFDEIVVVSADPAVALARAAQRDRCSIESVRKRYEAQLPIEAKVARATVVIDNSGTREELVAHVGKVWHRLSGAQSMQGPTNK